MNDRLLYELRGWAYWAKCLNPFRPTISISNLPLGLRLRAYKRDAVGRGLYRRKIHEPVLTRYLLDRFASPGNRNFIDVGANIGYFTGLFSKLAGPGGKVVAIEPEPQNLRLLRENIAENGLANVAVLPCAVGAKQGSAELGIYKAANRGRHSIVEANAQSRVSVPLRTLDEVAREGGAGADSWSLVKIDVEGYEGFVIEGARETLERTEALIVEFSPTLLVKCGLDPASTLRILTAHHSHIRRVGRESLAEVSVEDCLGTRDQMELVLER